MQISYIVVLGGGYTWNPEWAVSSNLIGNNLPRVTEAIRIWRQNPHTKLIFTGSATDGLALSRAQVAAQTAYSLGVPQSAIITLDTPRDTQEEAEIVKKTIGSQPFILLTSASHLPRAMVFFKKQGLNPLPAPANQLAISTGIEYWDTFFPSAQ